MYQIIRVLSYNDVLLVPRYSGNLHRSDADINQSTILDIPNPINGGGDLNAYKTIKRFYDFIE